jgi:hypothetical protein
VFIFAEKFYLLIFEDMLQAVMAGAGALSGIFGGLGKNRAIKRQIRALEAQKRENQDWYDRRYNEDATQRADAQRVLTMTEDAIRNRNRQAAGASAVMGGTEESLAATKAANAQAMGDAASSIALAAERRKDAIEGQYMQRKNALQSEINNLKGQKSSLFDLANNAIGGAGEGLKAGLAAGLWGNNEEKDE